MRPAAAIRWPMSRIEPSVVAIVLPSCTTADPSLATSSWFVPMTLPNLVSPTMASSGDKSSTATPSWAAVSTYSLRFFCWTPSWPLTWANLASSLRPTGMRLLIKVSDLPSAAISASVPATVFATPVIAVSQARASPMPCFIAMPTATTAVAAPAILSAAPAPPLIMPLNPPDKPRMPFWVLPPAFVVWSSCRSTRLSAAVAPATSARMTTSSSAAVAISSQETPR